MDTKKKLINAFLIIFAGSGLVFGAQRAVLYNKFRPIKYDARNYLLLNSVPPCGQSEMRPVVITDEWASIRVFPDMKTCITDPCWIVMRKSGGQWQGFTLGTCCFIDVPKELFLGDAEWWPEPIEEDKAAYRESQRFKNR